MERDVDIIVVGGGPAGIGAALAGAENGARVLLLERYGRLGGMAVQALVGPLLGGVRSAVVERILQATGGRTLDFARLDLQYYDLLAQAGVTVRLHSPVMGVLTEGQAVTGVQVYGKDGQHEFRTRAVIDATGDGDVAFLAGVPYELGREGDGLLQPMSVMFTVSGVAPEGTFLCGSEEEARIRKVGERTWEDIVTEGQRTGELAEHVGVIRLYRGNVPGRVTVNATQVNGLNGLSADDLTQAEIEGRRQAFQIVDFLRRHLPGYENCHAEMMPAVIGVRETRRFQGCARLEKADCLRGATFADAVVFDANFCIDIHNPSGSGQSAGHGETAQGQAERCRPYQIPYGCLVPQAVEGLLLAGRCISASHEAHASLRVMCIGMAIGVAAGAAAAQATAEGRRLRDVEVRRLLPYLLG